MKDSMSNNESLLSVGRQKNQDYDFSIQSIIHYKEELSGIKRKRTSVIMDQSDDEIKKKIKGKVKTESSVRQKTINKGGALKTNKTDVSAKQKCQYEEPIIEFQNVTNISLFKEISRKGAIRFFYRIKGDIIQVCESNNNENEMFYQVDYDEIDLPLHDLENQPLAGVDDLQELIPILLTFAEFLRNFVDITSLISHQVNTILKPIDLNTYIVFLLQNVYKINIKSITPITLKNTLSKITYQELEDNLHLYIDFLQETFYQPIEEKCPNNLPVFRILDTIIPDIQQVTDEIEKLGRIGDFSIITEMSEIITKIDSELFLVFEEKQISTKSDNKEQKNSLVNRLFYLLLIQINNYYKKTYPLCCSSEIDSMLNYAKEPYVFCFDCKVLICSRCFKHHHHHNYFDFACTIKKKFSNIHSSLTRFLNWKKEDASISSFEKIQSINKDYAEDHILFCILNGLESISDEYIANYLKRCSFQGEPGHITLLHYLDIILMEFLYKTIYPFKHNPDFLTYYCKLQSKDDRDCLLTGLLTVQNQMANQKIKAGDYYSAYIQVQYIIKSEKHVIKGKNIISKAFEKIGTIDDPLFENKLETPFDLTEPFFYEYNLNNGNYMDDSLEDFEQVKTNYSMLRANIQKIKAKEKKDNENKEFYQNKRASQKSFGKESVDPYAKFKTPKTSLNNFIIDKIDWIHDADSTNTFELKWYYCYNDPNEKCTKVKFIDGMGSLYQYAIGYFDEVLKSAAEYGTQNLLNKSFEKSMKEDDSDDDSDPVANDLGLFKS